MAKRRVAGEGRPQPPGHTPPPAMSIWLLLLRPLLLGLFLWLVLNITASAGIRMLLGWESSTY